MKTFITDDFLLHNEVARELYHNYAKDQPIFDYHCHLSPKDLAENRRFNNLHEVWLEGDHYKWRAMRTNGVAEDLITGDAEPWKKFEAWAGTVPATLRNPLYHWTHLELLRYFGIDDLLNAESAEAVWKNANQQLQGELNVAGILKKMKVSVICTTDDPVDDLAYHKAISESDAFSIKVYPAFRPDKALTVDQGESFKAWLDQLAAASGIETDRFQGFLEAIKQRHDYFHEMGCRLSDHGMNFCYADDCSEAEARQVFKRSIQGEEVRPGEADQFRSFMMLYFGRLDAARGWTKQLHVGALRNNNPRKLRELGPDTGYDSIGDWNQAEALSAYLAKLDDSDELPKTIIYNLNPADNYVFATMIGNFQDGITPGKLQFGSGWWFLDQKEGMEWQMNALSSLGLLSRFVGMLTDSRSFVSYPRHEYFRRILCNLIGADVAKGELPKDMDLLGGMVKDISFNNARNYFGMPTA